MKPTVEFENDRVRVTRVTQTGPGKIPPAARNDRLVIYLRDGSITRHEGGRADNQQHAHQNRERVHVALCLQAFSVAAQLVGQASLAARAGANKDQVARWIPVGIKRGEDISTRQEDQDAAAEAIAAAGEFFDPEARPADLEPQEPPAPEK